MNMLLPASDVAPVAGAMVAVAPAGAMNCKVYFDPSGISTAPLTEAVLGVFELCTVAGDGGLGFGPPGPMEQEAHPGSHISLRSTWHIPPGGSQISPFSPSTMLL